MSKPQLLSCFNQKSLPIKYVFIYCSKYGFEGTADYIIHSTWYKVHYKQTWNSCWGHTFPSGAWSASSLLLWLTMSLALPARTPRANVQVSYSRPVSPQCYHIRILLIALALVFWFYFINFIIDSLVVKHFKAFFSEKEIAWKNNLFGIVNK